MNSGAGVPGVAGADAAVGVPVSDPAIFSIQLRITKTIKKIKKYICMLEEQIHTISFFSNSRINFFFFGVCGVNERMLLHNWMVFVNVFLRNNSGRVGTQIYKRKSI